MQIETNIRMCAERIHRGVTIVGAAEVKARQARHTYDVAYAHAYLDAEGPAHERRYSAELSTQDVRKSVDVAELAYRHAERTAKAVEAELRAWQSVGASVRLMYGVETGIGR